MRLELLFLLPLTLILAASLKAEMPKHPSVLLDTGELTALRAELSKPGWKYDIYHGPGGADAISPGRGLKANADFWLAQPIEIPMYGGRGHNFFCDDGTRLVAPREYPFDPGPYRCPACGRLYEGLRYQGGHSLEIHRELAQGALDLALVSQIERKPEYASKAAEILLKYADAYPGPHTTITKGGIIEQSLDESVWSILLAQGYDLIYDTLTPEQRTKIEKFLRIVADGQIAANPGGNWLSWHLSCVGVIGYAIHDQALVDWATERFKRQIANELGDDGIWPESLHTYHFFAARAFLQFTEAARHAGVDLYHWEAKPGKSFLSMFEAPLDYAYPDLRLPAINDGWFASYMPGDAYEIAYRETGDPRYLWVAANGYQKGTYTAGAPTWGVNDGRRDSRFALFFGKETLAGGTRPRFTSRDYPGLGIGTLRSPDDSAVMTFHYGRFVGHGHPDKMSITLFANDRLWAADYGTQGYGSAINKWYQSGFSHNMVIVDGQNPARTNESPARVWLGDPPVEAVESTTGEAYPGVTWTRLVVRVGDYFVVRDRLSSKESHTYDFYLHSEGRLTLDDLAGKADAVPATEWIADLHSWDARSTLTGRWEQGEQALGLWMAGSTPITPMEGTCPADSGARTVPLLIARQTGKSAEFITVLYPHKIGESPRISIWDDRLTIIHGRYQDVLSLPENGVRPSVVRGDR